jgi:hypothetical protein
MATHTQSSRQIVIGLYATAFAASPICVRRLNAYSRPAQLTVKACHHFQKFLASDVFVFLKQLLSPKW